MSERLGARSVSPRIDWFVLSFGESASQGDGEHRNSRATASVTIGNEGHPVVPNTSFSRPISAFEFIPTSGSVMSALSRTPNSFRIPGTQNSPLSLAYGRVVPTHSKEVFDSSSYSKVSFLIPLPFSVFECLERYPASFDVGSLGQMQTDMNELKV